MHAKRILTLCCLLTLMLLTGATLSLAPAPALAGPVQMKAACPASVAQACRQRYGTCALCFCLGTTCYCENRCV